MKLSIVVPVYNEKKTILKIVEKVMALDLEKEIIIVDDCSTDGTCELLKERMDGKYPEVMIFYHVSNQGKGAALRTGFKHVKGEIITIQDADLEYEPEELKDLIKPITDGFADVVYGSRLSGGKPQRMYLFWHLVGNKFLTLITNLLYNTTISDMETCYKVMTKRVLDSLNLKSRRFNIEPEITAKIFKQHYRVYEMPISYYGRDYSEGKKICWRDGFSAIWTLIKYRFMD
ncbi:MAG: glycosyltransferase family 2 protein [Candidatus Omnitrophica bacterium]|nr:glycosyltransferase family 2 protein [Candidatus Omnitrophota bacterium]